MLIACWSPKGGSGTTVIACGLAAVLARSAPSPAGVLIADLAGDVPAVLGAGEPTGPGLASGWPRGPMSLRPLYPAWRSMPRRGSGCSRGPPGAPASIRPGRAEALIEALSADVRPVVADCGTAASGPGLALAAEAPLSLLVLRPCYLALRRALAAPVRPSGVVLLTEAGRSLGRRDVEDVLGVPVRAEVAVDEAVARVVDAGLLARRIPRALERALRAAVGVGASRDAA